MTPEDLIIQVSATVQKARSIAIDTIEMHADLEPGNLIAADLFNQMYPDYHQVAKLCASIAQSPKPLPIDALNLLTIIDISSDSTHELIARTYLMRWGLLPKPEPSLLLNSVFA